MKLILLVTLLSFSLFAFCDSNAQKLVESYKSIKACKDNYIIMQNGKKLLYDDGLQKSFNELLNYADIEDMFTFKYPKYFTTKLPKNYDPGRIRNEKLFKELYGHNKNEVKKYLRTIEWINGRKIRVTRRNGVDKALEKVVRDLKKLPKSYQKYLWPIGGTFTWRKIAGTNRLSVHSFGAAIDINVKYSDYWRWSKNKTFHNKIPKKIVEIFEKHGFIWGGKWYHYDTMHFEYRPEILK
jgi:uncharacterized protein YlzI (FlbEa/FlbD family)